MNLLTQELDPQSQYYMIPLTRGQFALVDACDYRRVNAFKWHAHWSPNTRTYYADRKLPSKIAGKQNSVSMHRFILDAPEGISVDHKNHDTLDNRRSNLRLANRVQQGANRKQQSNNTSGYKGVRWRKAKRKWYAEIGYQGKKIHLGVFTSAEEAHICYCAKAIELFGEFALFSHLPV